MNPINYIRSWIGVGSNKKVISLDQGATFRYLTLQTLDIIHDSPVRSETSSRTLAKQITYMQALWIITNNKVSFDVSALADLLYTNACDRILNPSDNLNTNDYVIYPVNEINPNTNFTILADTCDGNASIGRFCKDLNRRMISQASIYDNGAFSTNCGGRIYKKTNITPPKFLTISNDYYTEPSVMKSFGSATKSVCKNSGKTINSVYDTAIVGSIGGINVVIALMNAAMASEYIYFEHVVEPEFIVQRGYSPSVSNLSILHKSMSARTNISRTDQLLIYTELVAKHWGDLCMVTDVAGTSAYLLTNDTMVKKLCTEFGVNFSDGVNMYQRATPATNSITYEVNSGSIFGR